MTTAGRTPDELGIARLVRAFEDATVDPDQFGHEAHLMVAWHYLKAYGLLASIRRFCAALRRLTEQLGAESKYHETITWFYLIVANERCKSGPSKTWSEFRQANPDLFSSNPAFIRRFYSDSRLFSDIARDQFLLPDFRD